MLLFRRVLPTLMLLLLASRVYSASFSGYVPEFQSQLPLNQQEYNTSAFRNTQDPFFTQSNANSTLANASVPSQTPAAQLNCPSDLEKVNGYCVCPNNGVFINGICFAAGTVVSVVCNPPKIIYNNRCVCPQGSTYTASGGCQSLSDLVPSSLDCLTPRQLIAGKCICPNNGVFLSGKCYLRVSALYPTEPTTGAPNNDSIGALARIFREYDGSKNNQNFPRWGSIKEPLERRAGNTYADGQGLPRSDLPGAREISNAIGNLQGEVKKSELKSTMALVIWGQFMDHDVGITETDKNDQFDIPLPPDDTFFQGKPFLSFRRSKTIQPQKQIRSFANEITAWIDASNVYGSDETQARFLRSFVNGKLRTSRGSENLLPTKTEELGSLFIAGDGRINENVMLTSYHTIFVREHNRLCDRIKAESPNLNDEMIYQAARLYVMGLLQKITLEDFMPIMLGSKYDEIIGAYKGYNSQVNPNMPMEFTTGGFRVGHSLIVETYPMFDRFYDNYQNFTLGEVFFNPSFISYSRINDIMRGLSRNLAKQKSQEVTNSIRNLLVLDPDQRQIKLDLFSLNVQRARDQGLSGYNQAREAFGLPRVVSFEEVVADPIRASKLRFVYGHVDELELWVGIIAEDHVEGGILGELGSTIVGQTFRNLRDGDRFWYENAYPPSVVSEIKRTTFSDIIERNTGVVGLQKDIFHYYS